MTDRVEAFAADLAARVGDAGPSERKALLVGILNAHLPDGRPAILVGGGLVEILTVGAYTTGDVDLVGDRDAIAELLEGAGFEREGRHLVHPGQGLAVEIVAPRLDEDQTATRIAYGDHEIPCITIEDLLVDRLNAAKHWGSETDWEQAIILWEAHRDRIDRDRLLEKARYNDVDDLVDELEEVVREAE